jgi:hypothetical protein
MSTVKFQTSFEMEVRNGLLTSVIENPPCVAEPVVVDWVYGLQGLTVVMV